MKIQPPQSITQIEELIYQELMAEIPDLQPFVARGLARTAALRFQERGIAGLTPDSHHENEPK